MLRRYGEQSLKEVGPLARYGKTALTAPPGNPTTHDRVGRRDPVLGENLFAREHGEQA
jgi:hypothetical protein